MQQITSDELKTFSRYIYDISGIHLDQSKAYLVETRLKSLMTETESVSYYDLYHKAKSDHIHSLEEKIIDAICTQETMFFRDSSPFTLLRNKILPELIARKTSKPTYFPASLRIWSAACSTGQEIYSIAIVLKEFMLNPSKFNIQLLGTDISDSAISGAVSGEYSEVAVGRGLPKDKRNKYFFKTGLKWKIRDDIKSICTFKKYNLMDSFNGLGRFDIVFCRNVAIYFKPKDKVILFNKLADILEPGGYLIIGSSEALSGISSKFEPVIHSNMIFYQLK